ncbi:MAG: LD-carboxypeptidase, partial [Marinilabiliales bacterium]
IIYDNLKNYDFPIAFGFPAGHMNDNRALALGREYQLVVSEGGAKLKAKG